MPKVKISGQFIRDEKTMMQIIDAGFVLKNKQYDPYTDHYTFDIEGPEMPQCETVNILMNTDGDVWCEPQLPDKYSFDFGSAIAEKINQYFKEMKK